MGTGGAILKKRDLLVTLLYFLDTVVLMVSVMFSVWMRNEFKLSALTKELTRGSFWTSMVLLAGGICLRIHPVENLSGALGICVLARRLHSFRVRHGFFDNLCPHAHGAEIP